MTSNYISWSLFSNRKMVL